MEHEREEKALELLSRYQDLITKFMDEHLGIGEVGDSLVDDVLPLIMQMASRDYWRRA